MHDQYNITYTSTPPYLTVLLKYYIHFLNINTYNIVLLGRFVQKFKTVQYSSLPNVSPYTMSNIT